MSTELPTFNSELTLLLNKWGKDAETDLFDYVLANILETQIEKLRLNKGRERPQNITTSPTIVDSP